mmetsp:Transcript_37624/g.95026  ORF Transcript_37624/g.95026 Transcript_37624/m.95026 type:complete len:202 (+) Transcript_37624:1503-2108(+)
MAQGLPPGPDFLPGEPGDGGESSLEAMTRRLDSRFGSSGMRPASRRAAAMRSPRSPGSRISLTPGRRVAFFTLSSTTCTRCAMASRSPSSPGSMATTRLPQLRSSSLSTTAAPTSGPASSSTMSARLEPLCERSNTRMAPPPSTSLGSVVGRPSALSATSGGMGRPAALASSSPNQAYAAVAMSMVTHACPLPLLLPSAGM